MDTEPRMEKCSLLVLEFDRSHKRTLDKFIKSLKHIDAFVLSNVLKVRSKICIQRFPKTYSRKRIVRPNVLSPKCNESRIEKI